MPAQICVNVALPATAFVASPAFLCCRHSPWHVRSRRSVRCCRSSGHIDGGTFSSPQEESTFADGSVTFALQDNAASGTAPGKSPLHRGADDHPSRPIQRNTLTIPPPIPERNPSPTLPAPAHIDAVALPSPVGGAQGGGAGDPATAGGSGDEEIDFRLHSQFPQLPWSTPLTYMLTMRACLTADPAERPKFEQVRRRCHTHVSTAACAVRSSFAGR